MLTKEQLMPLLLNACPSFGERWAQYRDSHGDEEIVYCDLGEFADHLVHLYKADQTNEFDAVFQVIERFHLEGDDYVKEASIIGILEAIQNIAGNSGIDPNGFVQFLKPESFKWWQQLNDFWDGKIPYVGASTDEA